MHTKDKSRLLALPLALALGVPSFAQPPAKPASPPPAAPKAPGGTGVSAASIYKGVPLPPEGELLEVAAGTTERFTVEPYKLIGEPLTTKPEVATVTLGMGDANDKTQNQLPSIFTVTTAAQGEATVVLPLVDEKTGHTFERRLTVLVVDQISPAFREYISKTIKRVFPSVNVDVVVANGRTVLLTGYVDRAELVEPIVEFVGNALNAQSAGQQAGGATPAGGGGATPGGNRRVRVVNALRVVDAMQVQLKVVFATVNRTKLRQLGMSWRWEDLSAPVTGNFSLQLPGSQSTGSTLPFLVTRAGVFSYLGFLQALEQQGLGKVLAEPSLTALSGAPAFFNAGQNFPIVAPSATVLGGGSNGGQVGSGGSVTFVPIGTNLRFVPTVLGNGRIRLQVRPEVSEFVRDVPTPGGGTAPVISQRVAETTVELESGQTFVLAGMIRQQTSVSVNKIPIIGNLPIFGWAFQNKTYNQEEEELVIMATPYFADALNERPCKLPGRESRIPNDLEFYLGSKFEPPCFDDPYVGDWKKGWRAPQVKAVGPFDSYGRAEPDFVNPRYGISPVAYNSQVSAGGPVMPLIEGPKNDPRKTLGQPQREPIRVLTPPDGAPVEPPMPPVKSAPPAKKVGAMIPVAKPKATELASDEESEPVKPSKPLWKILAEAETEEPVVESKAVGKSAGESNPAGKGWKKPGRPVEVEGEEPAETTLPSRRAKRDAAQAELNGKGTGKILSVIPTDSAGDRDGLILPTDASQPESKKEKPVAGSDEGWKPTKLQ